MNVLGLASPSTIREFRAQCAWCRCFKSPGLLIRALRRNVAPFEVRRAAIRGHVLDAYDNRCAVTDLRMVNGGGKANAFVAHIRSVADSGPDVVQNGIALSATAHWLSDRHLISLDDECRLLVSPNLVPSELMRLFPQPGERVNARDAMSGEGRLTISTGPVSGISEIRSHPAVAGDFVAVTIADNATGISQDQLGNIFEPVFTTKGVGQGTGLGLSQVFGFAKRSGGGIRIDSTLGRTIETEPAFSG